GGAIGAGKGAGADQNERTLGFAQALGKRVPADHGEGFGTCAEIIVSVSQVGLRADQADREIAGTPALADTGIEHRGFLARNGADDQQRIGSLDAGNGGIEQIACTAPARIERRAVLPAIEIDDAEPAQQILERENLLDRGKVAHQRADALRIGRRKFRSNRLERFAPSRRAQPAAVADVRLIETLGAQAVDDVAGLVGDPFLVDVVVGARQDAHDLAAARIDPDRRAERVHHVDRFGLAELPRACRERVRLGGERADRTEIDDAALQLRGHRLFQISRDLHVLAAPGGAELGHAGDLGGEAHTAGALDAAVHRGLDQRAEILVLDRALVLAKAAGIDAIGHRLVLQVAFAALIADRAIERMIDQQEFHDAFARLAHHGRAGLDLGRLAVRSGTAVAHSPSAARHRLRRTDQLDQAHPAIAGDRQPLMEAEARNLGARGLARLQQRVLRGNVDLFAVDEELGHRLLFYSAATATGSGCGLAVY